MKIKQLLTVMTFLLTLTGVAEAKWWIFGQSNDEVSFSYLYLNSFSYEESGLKTSVPKSSLVNGELRINGKARIGKGKVGGVRVTLDDRATWQDAKFSEDGAFEFRFRPELAKSYVIYVEVTDTAGKANDVEKTRKELTIIESNAQQLVKTSLDELIAAYRGEDPARFMKLVSENFAGDSTNLDRAIRKDFSAFDNIDLRYTFNNVSIDPTGRAFAAITFSRSVTSSKSGKTLTDKGNTEFTFKLEEGAAKVFSMKNPLIFGLSDPEEVATGSSIANSSDLFITVDSSGNVIMSPGGILTSASSTVESGTNIALSTVGGNPPAAFGFADGEAVDMPRSDFFITTTSSSSPTTKLYGFLHNGAQVQIIQNGNSFSTLTEAPSTGYSTPATFEPQVGESYAFLLGNGKYALMHLNSFTSTGLHYQEIISLRIDFKYQTNGSRQF